MSVGPIFLDSSLGIGIIFAIERIFKDVNFEKNQQTAIFRFLCGLLITFANSLDFTADLEIH